MIDCLLWHRALAAQSEILRELNLATGSGPALPYAVLTLHRPSDLDDPRVLHDVLEVVATLAQELRVFFPVHPRSRERIEAFGLGHYLSKHYNRSSRHGLFPLQPLGYLDFLCLMESACLVLTDSGGIQEETTVLGIPCMTLRENTERPATVEHGTNEVVRMHPERILAAARRVLSGNCRKGCRSPLWDGHAAERIVRILVEHLQPELLASLPQIRRQANPDLEGPEA